MVGGWLVLFVGGGERAVFDIGVVGLNGFGYSLTDVGVVADEFGSEDIGHAEHILRDEDLTVDLGTCTDTDDFSRTKAKQPASWSARASRSSCSASCSSLARRP